MQLSPFEASVTDDWPHGAPLYGKRKQYPCHHDPYTFEVFPIHADEEPNGCHQIPRDAKEYEQQPIDFDISEANSGTEYVTVITKGDRPRLRWYSRSQFKTRFLYDPLNPPRPRGVDSEKWKQLAEDRVRGRTEATVSLNNDRRVLLRRIAQLWNGEVVCGTHLLADNCPSIKQITADLDEESLKRLYYDTNIGHDVLLAFGDADWFNKTDGFLKPTNLFRKQVWYDLNEKARLLLNARSEFPELKGDPYEGLVHRVTVGLIRLYDKCRGWSSGSYHQFDDYVLDVFGRDQNRQLHAREVMTEHNNWKLYRKTYQKMDELNKKGIKPVAIFDSRETAYSVFNHWHRAGLGELPNGPFNSEYSISEGQRQIKEAYQSDSYDWAVADWQTTWKLKQKTLGPNGPEVSREQITSLNW